MEELLQKLSEFWDERPEREKTIIIAVAVIIVVWFSWSFVIKGSLRSVWTAHKTVAAAEAEFNEAVNLHKNAAAFKKKHEDLEAELKQKRFEEEEFNIRIKAQGQMEDLLAGLRSEASKSSLKLVTLDVRSAAPAASAPGKADDVGVPKNGTASYKRNNIMLVCRGPYRQTVEFFLRVMEMPRVFSLTSFSMGKVAAVQPAKETAVKGAQVANSDATAAEDSPVEARLELEVFFR